MAIGLRKPVLFSVEHEPKEVEKRMAEFRQVIKGKKILFIELTSEEVFETVKKDVIRHTTLVGAFQRFVFEANKTGLKVVGLDNKKDIDELIGAGNAASIIGRDKEWDFSNAEKANYLAYNKREGKWIRKLKTANETAVIVMNPVHASEIAKKLRIPKNNIIGKLRERPLNRKLAKTEAIKRKARKAEEMRKKARQAGQATGFERRNLARKRRGK